MLSLVSSIILGFLLQKGIFANGQSCNKTMVFKVNVKNKAFINHTIKTEQANSDEFCQSLCFMDDRCISCTFDLRASLCNLSDSDHKLHPEHLVDAPNTIFWGTENTCNCNTKTTVSCRYNFEESTHRCYCKVGYGGSRCEKDLNLVALYPFNARYKARPMQKDVPSGATKDVECSEDFSSPSGGSCRFKGVQSSYIQIPNEKNGKLDFKGSFTMLAYIYAEQNGPLLNYNERDWGTHWWVTGSGNLSLFGRIANRHMRLAQPSAIPIPRSQWVFAGFTYDRKVGIASLWKDADQFAKVRLTPSDIATQFNIRIGVRIGDGRYFRGKIACLHMYAMALSKEDVEQTLLACKRQNFG